MARARRDDLTADDAPTKRTSNDAEVADHRLASHIREAISDALQQILDLM